MEELITRPAILDDIKTLLEFEQGVIAAERPFDPTLKEEAINYYSIEDMMASEDVELLVAELNGRLVGCGYARIEHAKPYVQYTRYAYLGFMYVLPEYRGLGVNKKIMQSLVRWAASKGILEARLEVYHGNEPAISAYEKIGFTKHMIEMRVSLQLDNDKA